MIPVQFDAKESGRQMIVSTKGRNALKLMMYLAQTDADVYTPLKIISARLDISLKYLENITSTLSKKKFVEAASGKGGGYRLSRPPEEYSVGEILRAVEESIEPVKCIENGTPICETADSCATLPIWKGLSALINNYLNGITLADVANYKEGEDLT